MTMTCYKPKTKFKMGICITQDTSNKQIVKSNGVIQRWFRDYTTEVWAKYRETTRLLGQLGLKRQEEAAVTRIQGARCVENATNRVADF